MPTQNYFLKIIILFIATGAGIFAIWYALIRPESADWISEKVVHQASPYAISEIDNGKVIVDNVISGYEFILPNGFKTNGARNLSFYLDDNGARKCETRHYLKTRGAKYAAENLVFELVDKNEKGACAAYLEKIKKSAVSI